MEFSREKHLRKIGFKKGYIPWNKGKKTGISPMKGKKHTEEAIKKMKENNAHYWKCKKFSEEHKKRLKENHADFNGDKSPNWKGGYSRNREEEKQWRISVFVRDIHTCQKCGAKNGEGKSVYLNSHHIKNFAQYLELRFKMNNGITLCVECHKKFHKKYGYKNNSKKQLKEFLK